MKRTKLDAIGRFGMLPGAVTAAVMFAAAFGPGQLRPAAAQDFDINSVLYCEEGKPLGNQTVAECEAARAAFMANCTVCHAFVVTVKQQKDPAGWDATLAIHAGRVPDLSETDTKLIGDFLKSHFNPQNPPVVLPPELDALSDLPPA